MKIGNKREKKSFEIGEAAVAYSGTYDAAKKTITGIGVENEKAANINFVKD